MQPLNIKLTLSKSTKGTHVYEMKNEAGQSLGSIYLPKLVLPAEPLKEMAMTVGPVA